jgi:hypothetical protein
MTPKNNILYGLYPGSNCCLKKTQACQKGVHSLLPISYFLKAVDNQCPHANYLTRSGGLTTDATLDLTYLCKDPNVFFFVDAKDDDDDNEQDFINSPPNDLCVRSEVHGKEYFEAKLMLYKGKSTQVILRQDCFGFNCIQNIFRNNPHLLTPTSSAQAPAPASLEELLALSLPDQTEPLKESPYLVMLLWTKDESTGDILFDHLIVSDVYLLQAIQNVANMDPANASSKKNKQPTKESIEHTTRAKEAVKLIQNVLKQLSATGKVAYKPCKGSTVPHQKASLFPFRDWPELRMGGLPNFTATSIKSSDIILEKVRPDASFWHEVEKSHLLNEIRDLKLKLKELATA